MGNAKMPKGKAGNVNERNPVAQVANDRQILYKEMKLSEEDIIRNERAFDLASQFWQQCHDGLTTPLEMLGLMKKINF